MIRLTLHSGDPLFLVPAAVVAVRDDDDGKAVIHSTCGTAWHVQETAQAVAYEVAYALGGASP